jgi:uncharacterized protein YacL
MFNGFSIAFSFLIESSKRTVEISKMSCKFVNKVKTFFLSQVKENQLFAVDKKLMKFIGIWPTEKTNWRIFALIIFVILVNVLPLLNSLKIAIENKDVQKIGLTVPENINNCFILFGVLVFLKKRKTLQKFVAELETEWNQNDDEEEWKSIKEKSTKTANTISFLATSAIHFIGIFYSVIPNLTSLFKRFILNDETAEVQMFQNVE